LKTTAADATRFELEHHKREKRSKLLIALISYPWILWMLWMLVNPPSQRTFKGIFSTVVD